MFFPEEPKVGVKVIKTFAERMRNESVNRAIMVVIGSLTPFSRQCLAEMAPKYYIEVVRAPSRCPPCSPQSLAHPVAFVQYLNSASAQMAPCNMSRWCAPTLPEPLAVSCVNPLMARQTNTPPCPLCVVSLLGRRTACAWSTQSRHGLNGPRGLCRPEQPLPGSC